MKTPVISIIVILFISFNLLIAQNKQSKQKTGNLTIIVSGLKNNRGNIKIGLFNSEESYKGKKKKFKGAILKIEHKKAIWIVKNIPLGFYAIKTFHDEDDDDQIDTNFIGLPTERYGFSNNVKGFFGPPSFKKARFYLKSKNMKKEIHLK